MVRHTRMSGGARPDGRARWHTLEHGGVMLPPPYAPHGRPVLWRQRTGAVATAVHLSPEAEEAITTFVRRGGTVVEGRANLLGSEAPALAFWFDWREMLPVGCPIRSLGGCDLSRIAAAVASEKAKQLQKKNNNKNAIKKVAAVQSTAIVDGVPQPVAPFAVDRPGIFAGRNLAGELNGRYRRRIEAADVTLNLGRGAQIPSPGGWGGVVHDPTVDWVARWRDPVTGIVKYARLGAASLGEQSADRDKYDLARRLHARLPALRRRTDALLASRRLLDRQLGACVWLVDRLALRVGSGTAAQAQRSGAHGATSLLAGHATLLLPDVLRLDFPGKDGVRYVRTLAPAPADEGFVAAVREGRAKASSPDVALFGGVTAEAVAGVVSSVMAEDGPGVGIATPKVLRTCRASTTFERTLEETGVTAADGSAACELALSLAGARVAVLCNHRRGSPAPLDLSDLDAAIASLVSDLASRVARKKGGKVVKGGMVAGIALLTRRLSTEVMHPAGLSLATARTSYIDPRVVFAFYARCRQDTTMRYYGSAVVQRRFAWAADTPGDFRFRSVEGPP